MFRNVLYYNPGHGSSQPFNYPLTDFATVSDYYQNHGDGTDDPKKRAVNPYVSYGIEDMRWVSRLQSYVGERWSYYGYFYNDPQDLNAEVSSFLPVWGKLQDIVQGHSFNAGVALGEGHKTVATVLGGLKRLTRSIHLLRKGNIVGGLSAIGVQTSDGGKSYFVKAGTKAFANGSRRYRIKKDPKVDLAGCWLEMQYGWKPLLNDIYESVNAFYKHTSKSQRSKVFRASKVQNIGFQPIHVVGSTTKVVPSIVPTQSGWLPVNDNMLGIRATITEPTPFDQELGLQDPLSIAWELVPFSFVADWFIPIGNFLEALSFVQRTSGTYSTKRLRRKTWAYYFPGLKWYSGSNPNAWFQFDKTGVTHYDMRSYRNWNFTRSASYPITSASVLTENSLPAFKPMVKAASAMHVANAIALLAAAMRK